MGLGSPPSPEKIHAWIAADPKVEFKLDSNREWTQELIRDLAATNAVRVVDIKGLYSGDWIDSTPDPVLVANLANLLPDAWLEDVYPGAECWEALGESGRARVTWDYPIHSIADLDDLDHTPCAINIKPSRFGSWRELLGAIEWCEARDIPNYSGGQYEIGWGRTQGQMLAAAFYPGASNDIAPAVYHTAKPGDDVPTSPLTVPDTPGFGFDA
jgi:hypothetical protein